MTSFTVTGTVTHKDDGVVVSFYGRQRIAAVLAAAKRHLNDTDEVVEALEHAVAEDLDEVDLPAIWDDHDARVLDRVLSDVRNGDDEAPLRAIRGMWKGLQQSYTTCPHCDGTGEVLA